MKTKITIPDPCHENWNEMTPTQRGAFCDVCSKEVKDFTGKSDTEIHTTLQNSESNVCGRFRTDQIDRPLQLQPKTNISWMVPFAASFALVLLSKEAKSQEIMGEVAFPIEKATTKGQVKVVVPPPPPPMDSVSEYDLITLGNAVVEKKDTIKPIKCEFVTMGLVYQPVVGKLKVETEITEEVEDSIVIIEETMGDIEEVYIPAEENDSTVEGKIILVDEQKEIHQDSIHKPQQEIQPKPNERSHQPHKQEEEKQNFPQFDPLMAATAYPNPTQDWTTITVEKEGLYNILVINAHGKQVLRKTFFGSQHRINLSNYKNGLYLINITDSSGTRPKVLRVVKRGL